MSEKEPRVTLTFYVTDPEQRLSAERALKADSLALAIQELYNDVFRPVIKYSEDTEKVEAYQEVWEKCHAHFEDLMEKD